jgi:crotonobetainyl-CoA:carnitine CoA-transferase CaiB-like acyl-CoA transferase
MSQTPWHLERGAPDRGAHTTEVMADVAGYGPTQIASLMERGIAIGATS